VNVCAICGSTRNVENAHPFDKRMGGRGSKAPAHELVTVPLCAGTGGNTDPSACHGAVHAHHVELSMRDGALWFAADDLYAAILRLRGVRLRAHRWYAARFVNADPDAMPEARYV